MINIATAKDRLVLALDIDNDQEALKIVAELKDHLGMFKVGHQLFTAYGPDIVRKITGMGGRVFLDLKYHDIPHTVAKASAEAVKLGVSIFNVHALGGFELTIDGMRFSGGIKPQRKPLELLKLLLLSNGAPLGAAELADKSTNCALV